MVLNMERVGLIGDNSIEYISILVDIWNNGDCAVLIDWRIPYITAVEMMKEANVVKCYIEKKLFDKIHNINNNIEIIIFEKENNYTKSLPLDIYNKFKPNYSKNEAIIIYSSGTTGKSKGIILSHYAINKNADSIIDYMQIKLNDSLYMVRTISHASSVVGELLVCLKSKLELYIGPTIVPPRYIISNLIRYNITILTVNPTQLLMYTNELTINPVKFTNLRSIYVSGAPLSNNNRLKAMKVFDNTNIYNAYGLTEAGPRVSVQSHKFNHDNSIGKPIMGVQIAIINEDGHICASYEKGIVHVKTDSVFSGYVKGKNKFDSLYNDWLNTGDIGYMIDNGEIFITGRLDDLIIINGHKIYSGDVEKVIREYELIKDCVVISEPIENNEYFMICLYELYDTNNFRLNALIKHCNNYLSLYEIPQKWLYLESIPRTLNNKISKADIKALLKSNLIEG